MDKNIMRIAELCEQEEPKNVYTELTLSSICRQVWIFNIDEGGKYDVAKLFTQTEYNGEVFWTDESNKRVFEEDIIRELEAVRNA